MRSYSLARVSDTELTRGLAALVSQDRITTAMLLAHIAEFDERRLYLPAAYPSMHAYCVGELRLSEDAAYKRITAARAARRFPAIFDAVADGRLSLTAVQLLAPHLTDSNSADLLRAAAGRTNAAIQELFAARAPQSESIPLMTVVTTSGPQSLAARRVEETAVAAPATHCSAPEHEAQLATWQADASGGVSSDGLGRPAAHPAAIGNRISPIASDRFLLQLSIGRETRDKLEHARNLLGHQLPEGDVARVLDLALDSLIEALERRKFARASRPHRGAERRASVDSRRIPARVKRAVWERDGGQCTFTSGTGRRCDARRLLEFDHVTLAARGGASTVKNLRLRCRAHNQYGAERVFGADFMRGKRAAAHARAAATTHAASLGSASASRARPAADALRTQAVPIPAPTDAEIITPLCLLGFRLAEARRAAASCRDLADAPLESRIRRALAVLRPRPAAAWARSRRAFPSALER